MVTLSEKEDHYLNINIVHIFHLELLRKYNYEFVNKCCTVSCSRPLLEWTLAAPLCCGLAHPMTYGPHTTNAHVWLL
jgi:hypothetical protein